MMGPFGPFLSVNRQIIELGSPRELHCVHIISRLARSEIGRLHTWKHDLIEDRCQWRRMAACSTLGVPTH